MSATPIMTRIASAMRVGVSASFRITRASTATMTGAVYRSAAAPATPTPPIANWYAISKSATMAPPPNPTSSQPRRSARNRSRWNRMPQITRATVPIRTRQKPMLVAGMRLYRPVESGPVVPHVAPAPRAQR